MKIIERFFVITCIACMIIGLLVGCSNEPFIGIVVDKEYTPIHTERRHHMVGKIHTTRVVTIKSKWLIWIADRYNIRHVEIDSLKYQTLKIGDRIKLQN